jgi:hypothetical protein
VAEPQDSWADGLSPSVRVAFEWALASTGERVGESRKVQTQVGTAALLVGIVRSHEGYSEPEALLQHFGLTREQLFDAIHLPMLFGGVLDLGGTHAHDALSGMLAGVIPLEQIRESYFEWLGEGGRRLYPSFLAERYPGGRPPNPETPPPSSVSDLGPDPRTSSRSSPRASSGERASRPRPAC